MSSMNVVDSSGWLEYFAGTTRAKLFARPIENASTLLVPSISIYEVFKKVMLEFGETEALHVIAHMQKGRVIELDASLAIFAANLSIEHKLPMADSIILATAKQYNATIWTQDRDFKKIKGVKYFPKNE